MATLPISSTIAQLPLTGPRIRRAHQAAQATTARRNTAARRLACRLALRLSLLPHRLPLVTRLDAFWDTWAVRQKINRAQRPKLRRGLAIERRRVLIELRAVRHASTRASWPATTTAAATAVAADARWRGEVRDLLEHLGVVIETTTDWHGVTHFTACDLTPARRACLTQPSLDALLFDADEPAERVALGRPHNADTQPALPVVKPD